MWAAGTRVERQLDANWWGPLVKGRKRDAERASVRCLRGDGAAAWDADCWAWRDSGDAGLRRGLRAVRGSRLGPDGLGRRGGYGPRGKKGWA